MLFTGEKPGAVSAVSGHHVTLPPGTQDDAELPQHRQRATRYERGDLCPDKITITSLHLNTVLSSLLVLMTVLQTYLFSLLDCVSMMQFPFSFD